MLTLLERRFLNEYQQGFPLHSNPWQTIAKRLQVTEKEVLQCAKRLQKKGLISRIGAVLAHQKVGASTLAAVSVAKQDIEHAAMCINQFEGVNHNYLRDHHYNLWFVVTGENQHVIDSILQQIEQQLKVPVLNLPMEKDYHIDLGFPLWC